MYSLKGTGLILSLLVVVSILGCDTSQYYTICSAKDFPLYSVRGTRCIILNEQILNNNRPLFEKAIQWIENRKYVELETYLSCGDYPQSDVELCKALMCFNQGRYETAQVHLANITAFEYNCLVKLLNTDIEYEMKLSAGLISPNRTWEQVDPRERAKNRSLLIKKYQEVFDCDLSEENHSMVKMRTKQLKYAK